MAFATLPLHKLSLKYVCAMLKMQHDWCWASCEWTGQANGPHMNLCGAEWLPNYAIIYYLYNKSKSVYGTDVKHTHNQREPHIVLECSFFFLRIPGSVLFLKGYIKSILIFFSVMS